MARGLRAEKVAEWTSRLRRFEEANQTVARFCVDEGVSQPSFYAWKKKLRELTPALGGSLFQPVHVSSCLADQVGAIRQESIIRLGRDIEIELGSELSVVESIVKQLLASVSQSANPATDELRSMEATSC